VPVQGYTLPLLLLINGGRDSAVGMGWIVRGSNRGGEVFRPVQTSPEAHLSLLYNGGRSVVLTTHVLLEPSCKAVGRLPPLPPSASPEMSWGDLFLLPLLTIFTTASFQILSHSATSYSSHTNSVKPTLLSCQTLLPSV